MHFLFLISWFFVVLIGNERAVFAAAVADKPLIISYFDRPPYYVKGQVPSGILVDRIRTILTNSGISWRFEEMSIKRITQEIKKTSTPMCSVGWFKTKERESYALFSDSIWYGQPLQVAIRSDNLKAFSGMNTFAQLSARSDLCPGLTEGFSYGNDIDKAIRKRQAACRLGDAEHANLIKMLVAKRFDYLLTTEAELEHMLKQSGIKPGTVALHSLSDLPRDEARYLMCNKGVSLGVLEAINKAIAAVPQSP